MAAPSDKVELKIKETIVNTKIDLTSDDVVVNKDKVSKWRLYHSGDTEAEHKGEIDNITTFTPKKPGYIWLRAAMPEDKYAYFKIAVKADENTPAPKEYDEAFPKENMKPLKAPIQLGYFRTWHDYWSWVPDDASHKISDVPAEVDIVAVFPDYTEDGNPFWEKLKMEYVPKLNKQGTRVIRTIGIKDVDGRRGVSLQFQYEKNEEGYKALAAEIVKEYVTKYNLDGLDIDFEYHDSGNLNVDQAKVVIEEISKIIGPKNPDRTSNLLFILDTNKDANAGDGLFMATKDCYDYVIRQNYSRNGYLTGYDTYKDVLPKEKYLTGFSYYEENDNNQWGNVPSEDLVADRETNETLLNNPDELFEDPDFLGCTAYKQAEWAAKGGYGGVFSYAIERDGVAHGNDKKFFKNKEGGQPSKYFFSKALKHLMQYESAKNVEDIKLIVNEFQAGNTLELNAAVEPADAVKKEITWSVVNDPQKTTAKDAMVTEGNKLTAKGEGKITLKAVVVGGIKGENIPKFVNYEKEVEIKVNKAPEPPSPSYSPSYPVVPTLPAKTEKAVKEEKKPEIKEKEEKKPEIKEKEEKKPETKEKEEEKPETKENSATDIAVNKTPQEKVVEKKVLKLPSLKKTVNSGALKGLDTRTIKKVVLPQNKAKINAAITDTALSELVSKKITAFEVKGKNFTLYLNAKNLKSLNKLTKKQLTFKAAKLKTGKIKLQIFVDGRKLTAKQIAKLKIKVK